jgi:hypothetical protein
MFAVPIENIQEAGQENMLKTTKPDRFLPSKI